MKRIISFILALITLSLCFSACANTDVEDETSTADVNATPVLTDAATETDPLTDEWGRPYIASPTA